MFVFIEGYRILRYGGVSHNFLKSQVGFWESRIASWGKVYKKEKRHKNAADAKCYNLNCKPTTWKYSEVYRSRISITFFYRQYSKLGACSL